MKIAIYQMLVEHSMEKNFFKIKRLIESQISQDIDIVVLPETALTGYLGFSLESLDELEPEEIFEYLDKISKLAIQNKVAIVTGQYMKRCGSWYNNMIFFGDDGKCYSSYDKAHLIDKDCYEVEPGGIPETFTYKGVKMMLGICHDIRYPEHAMVGGDSGAQVLINSFYGVRGVDISAKVRKTYDAMIMTRAIENGMYVVSPNVVNNEQMVRSQICSPQGDIVVKAENCNEQLLVGEIMPELAGYGWAKRRRRDLYGSVVNQSNDKNYFKQGYWQKEYYNSNHGKGMLDTENVKRLML